MKISRNTVATVSFVVTDENDQVVGRTDPKHPIVALMGYDYLVPGLEKALDGHEKGDELAIKLNPADAYGEVDPQLIQTIDRSMFGDFPVEVGSTFEADSNTGRVLVTVTEIKEDTVVVDGNHPLAGKTVNFLVTVEDVRAATEEEIAHGHAHENGVCPSEAHHCGCGGGHGGGCCGGHGHHHGHGGGCCGGHGKHGGDEKEHSCGCHGHDEEEKSHGCGCHGHDEEEKAHGCGCHGHNEEKKEHSCGCAH